MIKKSKNIFEEAILHQNLFHTEATILSKIGDLQIKPGWLKNANPKIYNKNIYLALNLAELNKKLYKLQDHHQENQQLNAFKMAQIKHQIQKLDNVVKDQQIQKYKNFQLPQKIIAQKVSQYFHTSYLREAQLKQINLIISSKKKQQGIVLDLSKYNLKLENKSKPLRIIQFQHFSWPEQYEFRLLIYNTNLRPYCLYSSDKKNLNNIIDYVQKQSLSSINLDFLSKASQQYFQKIRTLFGTRIRQYDDFLKNKRNRQIFSKNNKFSTKKTFLEAEEKQSYEDKVFKTPASLPLQQKNSQSLQSSPKPKSFNSSVFKIRNRRSTIHYDQLQQSIELSKIPDYKINDFKLNLRDDEQSNNDHQFNKSQENGDQNIQQQQQEENDPSNKSQSYIEKHQYKTKVTLPKNSPNLEDNNGKKQFNIVQQKLNRHILIDRIQTLFPCERKQFYLNILQKAQPQIQSQNSGLFLYTSHKIQFIKKQSNHYVACNNKSFMISDKSNQFIFQIQTEVEKINKQFELSLTVDYQINASVLFYSLNFCGIINIQLSPHQIFPCLPLSTISFMKEYLQKKNQSYYFKQDFLSYKKKYYELKLAWNHKIVQKIIKSTHQEAFQKALFFGIPQSILQKIVKSLKKQNKPILLKFQLKTQEYQKIAKQIQQQLFGNIKNVMKINKLVSFILSTTPNKYLNQRLLEVQTFFSYKYGSIKVLAHTYVIEIIRKIYPILTMCKTQQQVKRIVQLYLEVEYEVDQLFEEISKYFLKGT